MLKIIEIKLKNILVERNLTMKEIVAKIDMTENGFAYSLKNDTLKIITLEKIAKILDVPITYFFTEEGNLQKTEKKYSTSEPDEMKELRIEISKLLKENSELKSKIIKLLERTSL